MLAEPWAPAAPNISIGCQQQHQLLWRSLHQVLRNEQRQQRHALDLPWSMAKGYHAYSIYNFLYMYIYIITIIIKMIMIMIIMMIIIIVIVIIIIVIIINY